MKEINVRYQNQSDYQLPCIDVLAKEHEKRFGLQTYTKNILNGNNNTTDSEGRRINEA